MFVSRLVYVSKDRHDRDVMTFRGEDKTSSGAIMSVLYILREDSNNLAASIRRSLESENIHRKPDEILHLIAMVQSYLPPTRPQTHMEPGDRYVDFVYTAESGPILLHRGFIRHEQSNKYLIILYQ